MIHEVIFSGAQLALYSGEERVFVYWYAAQVIEVQLARMDELVPVLQGPRSTRSRP